MFCFLSGKYLKDTTGMSSAAIPPVRSYQAINSLTVNKGMSAHVGLPHTSASSDKKQVRRHINFLNVTIHSRGRLLLRHDYI